MVNKSGLMCLALVVGLGWHYPADAQNAGAAWVTAWGTSQQGLGATKITNATVRMIARVTIPGDSVKVRLDNTFGLAPVVFDKASIGPRVRGAALAAGAIKPLTFGGNGAVTVPAGATVESDPVSFHVDAQQDVAVSLGHRSQALGFQSRQDKRIYRVPDPALILHHRQSRVLRRCE